MGGAILLALFVGIPLRIIRKIIIDGDSEYVVVEPTIDAILPPAPTDDEDATTADDEQKESTPRRRVSWNDKVVIDDTPVIKRPPTPVWLKDDNNVQDFWVNEDEDEVDEGHANDSHDEDNIRWVENELEFSFHSNDSVLTVLCRAEDPVEITLSDLENDAQQVSDEASEPENDATSDDE